MYSSVAAAVFLLFFSYGEGTPRFNVETVFTPAECGRKSVYGDQVFVNFVGRKQATGEEFDRR